MKYPNLRPGEVYEKGDPLIFASAQTREIFYNPPTEEERARCPFVFDTLEAEDRFHHPERYVDNPTEERRTLNPFIFDSPEAEDRFCHPERYVDSPSSDALDEPSEIVLEALPEGTGIEVLPPTVQLPEPPPSAFYGTVITGSIYYYQREQTGGCKQEVPPPNHETRSQSPALNPMQMADKLMQIERFSLFERNLYLYDTAKGIHRLIDRDDTKGIIINRLAEDLRVRGTANQVRDVYEFLRLDPRLEVVEGHPQHLLAFTNGVLNLQTGKFALGHSPDTFLTWRLEIPFMPEERDCPHFMAVLQHISGGDPVLIARALETMAYLVIPSAFAKGIVLFQGLSGTGKSVVARLIASFLNPGIISHVGANQFNQRFSAATLQGRRLNISMDLPGGKIGADAVAFLKQVTGGDEVFVESKGVDGHSAHLNCRFLFGTNHAFAPTIRDDAFLDRTILLPFYYPVPPAEMDPELDNKLALERTAIFNALLEAFYRLQRNHYQFTGEDIYGIRIAGLGNSEADPIIIAFVRECCCIDFNAQIPSSRLFDAYKNFLAGRGILCTENTQQFSQHFNEATPASVILKKIRINGKPTNCYTGIMLKGENYAK